MAEDVDKMAFDQGAAMIRREIDQNLSEHQIDGADVQAEASGPAGPLRIILKVRGKSAETEFTAAEVTDSAHAIDHPAATKVRQLVSHFVA